MAEQIRESSIEIGSVASGQTLLSYFVHLPCAVRDSSPTIMVVPFGRSHNGLCDSHLISPSAIFYVFFWVALKFSSKHYIPVKPWPTAYLANGQTGEGRRRRIGRRGQTPPWQIARQVNRENESLLSAYLRFEHLLRDSLLWQ